MLDYLKQLTQESIPINAITGQEMFGSIGQQLTGKLNRIQDEIDRQSGVQFDKDLSNVKQEIEAVNQWIERKNPPVERRSEIQNKLKDNLNEIYKVNENEIRLKQDLVQTCKEITEFQNRRHSYNEERKQAGVSQLESQARIIFLNYEKLQVQKASLRENLQEIQKEQFKNQAPPINRNQRPEFKHLEQTSADLNLNLKRLNDKYSDDRQRLDQFVNQIQKEQMQEHRKKMMIEEDPIIKELSSLKQDYINNGGGKDENFLKSIDNLRNFYLQYNLEETERLINNKRKSQLPMISETSFNGYYSQIPDEILFELRNLKNQNQKLKRQNSYLNQKNIYSSQMANSMIELPSITSQTQSIIERQSQEQMLQYIQAEQLELVVKLGRLQKDSYDFQQLSLRYNKLKAMQRSAQESLLSKTQIGSAITILTKSLQEKNNNSSNRLLGNSFLQQSNISMNNSSMINLDQSMTKSLLNDPSLFLKQYNQSKRLMPRVYDPEEGFSVNWDLITDVPDQLEKIRINFGIGKRLNSHHFTYLQTGQYACEVMDDSSRRVVFQQEKQLIRNVTVSTENFFYIQLWGYHTTLKNKIQQSFPQRYAWSLLELFDHNNNLQMGKFNVPIYDFHKSPQVLLKRPLSTMYDVSIFFRISLPLDELDVMPDPLSEIINYIVPATHFNSLKLQKTFPQLLPPGQQHTDGGQIQIKNAAQFFEGKSEMPIDDSLGQTGTSFDTKSKFSSEYKKGLDTLTDLSEKKDQLIKDSIKKVGENREKRFSSIPFDTQVRGLSDELINKSNDTLLENGLVFRFQQLIHFDEDIYGRSLYLSMAFVHGIALIRDIEDNPMELETKIGGTKSIELHTLDFQFETVLNFDLRIILQNQNPVELQHYLLYFTIFDNADRNPLFWQWIQIFKVEKRLIQLNKGRFRDFVLSTPTPELPLEGQQYYRDTIICQYQLLDPNQNDEDIHFIDLAQQIQIEEQEQGRKDEEQKTVAIIDDTKSLLISVKQLQQYVGKPEIFCEITVSHLQQGTIFDQQGQKCFSQSLLILVDKEKNNRNFKHKKYFHLNEFLLHKEFKRVERSKLNIKLTFKAGKEQELIGYVDQAVFKVDNMHINQGPFTLPIFQNEKGKEQKTQFSISFIIKMEQEKIAGLQDGKFYDPNDGVFIDLKSIKNFKEKFNLSFELSFVNRYPKSLIADNEDETRVYRSQDKVEPDQKQKEVIFNDILEFGFNMDRVKDLLIDDLHFLHLLLVFVNSAKSDEIYGWIAHPLYLNQAFNKGQFTREIIKAPIPEQFPIDESTAKKVLSQFQFEIGPARMDDSVLGGASPMITNQKGEKVYDPESGIQITLNNVTNFKEKFGLKVLVKMLIVKTDNQKMETMPDNYQVPCETTIDTICKVDLVQKQVPIFEALDLAINIDRVKEEFQDKIAKISLVVLFYRSDKPQELFGWFSHQMFSGQAVNTGTSTTQIYKGPVPDLLPYDEKKVQQTNCKIQYTIDQVKVDQYKPIDEDEIKDQIHNILTDLKENQPSEGNEKTNENSSTMNNEGQKQPSQPTITSEQQENEGNQKIQAEVEDTDQQLFVVLIKLENVVGYKLLQYSLSLVYVQDVKSGQIKHVLDRDGAEINDEIDESMIVQHGKTTVDLKELLDFNTSKHLIKKSYPQYNLIKILFELFQIKENNQRTKIGWVLQPLFQGEIVNKSRSLEADLVETNPGKNPIKLFYTFTRPDKIKQASINAPEKKDQIQPQNTKQEEISLLLIDIQKMGSVKNFVYKCTIGIIDDQLNPKIQPIKDRSGDFILIEQDEAFTIEPKQNEIELAEQIQLIMSKQQLMKDFAGHLENLYIYIELFSIKDKGKKQRIGWVLQPLFIEGALDLQLHEEQLMEGDLQSSYFQNKPNKTNLRPVIQYIFVLDVDKKLDNKDGKPLEENQTNPPQEQKIDNMTDQKKQVPVLQGPVNPKKTIDVQLLVIQNKEDTQLVNYQVELVISKPNQKTVIIDQDDKQPSITVSEEPFQTSKNKLVDIGQQISFLVSSDVLKRDQQQDISNIYFYFQFFTIENNKNTPWTWGFFPAFDGAQYNGGNQTIQLFKAPFPDSIGKINANNIQANQTLMIVVLQGEEER